MKNLCLIGVAVIFIGSFINGLLIRNGISGLPREGMRLIVLIGVGIFIVGIIKAIKK